MGPPTAGSSCSGVSLSYLIAGTFNAGNGEHLYFNNKPAQGRSGLGGEPNYSKMYMPRHINIKHLKINLKKVSAPAPYKFEFCLRPNAK